MGDTVKRLKKQATDWEKIFINNCISVIVIKDLNLE